MQKLNSRAIAVGARRNRPMLTQRSRVLRFLGFIVTLGRRLDTTEFDLLLMQVSIALSLKVHVTIAADHAQQRKSYQHTKSVVVIHTNSNHHHHYHLT